MTPVAVVILHVPDQIGGPAHLSISARVAARYAGEAPAPCGCTDEGRFAVTVRVLDAATGEQIRSTPIGIVTYGENIDTLRASPNHVLSGGPTEPGTYDVEVRAEGYRVWRRENVKVSESGWCAKVQTAELTSKMVRLAAAGSQTGEAERSRLDASPLLSREDSPRAC